MLSLCSRIAAGVVLAVAAVAAVTTPAMADGGLVRIEPRPYYGAVVTVEHGVRVYRPLPSPQLTVISPDGRTPINITYNRTVDNRSYEGGNGPAAVPDSGLRYGDGYGYGGGFYGGYGRLNNGRYRYGTSGRWVGAAVRSQRGAGHIRRLGHH